MTTPASSHRPTDLNLPAWCELLDMSGQERVLEIGCGDCSFLAALAPICGELVGLEMSAAGAVGAHEMLKQVSKPCSLRIGSLLEFDDAAGFDVILVRRGLGHVPERERSAWCEKIARLLRPGGVVYLTDETARADLWLSSDTGWHEGMVSSGLEIRREVMKVPAGLEVLAAKPVAA